MDDFFYRADRLTLIEAKLRKVTSFTAIPMASFWSHQGLMEANLEEGVEMRGGKDRHPDCEFSPN